MPDAAKQKLWIDICDYCHKQIIWTVVHDPKTGEDTRLQVDAEPDKNHGDIDVRIEGKTTRSYPIAKKSQAAAMRAAGVGLRVAHHLTCTEIQRWRAGRKKP